jgi:hypothetical protein
MRTTTRSARQADCSAAWSLFPERIAHVCHGALYATTVAESLTHGTESRLTLT